MQNNIYPNNYIEEHPIMKDSPDSKSPEKKSSEKTQKQKLLSKNDKNQN